MSEKDFIEYKELFHDYFIFKECFGVTKIMPMDIDGIIERNNKFLVIEFKPSDKSISKGQHITLKYTNEDAKTFVSNWFKVASTCK
jgi:hypothetical protein